MIRFLQFLFYGHIHKWKIIDKYDLAYSAKTSTGTRYVLQCSKCGDIKMHDAI